jgi:hypothetical protein
MPGRSSQKESFKEEYFEILGKNNLEFKRGIPFSSFERI